MKTKNLFEAVRRLNLPRGKFALFGSAPMCIRGWIELNHDVDILVTPEIWKTFHLMGGWKLKRMSHGSEYLSRGGLELWKDWKPGRWNISALIRRAEIIEGLPFAPLKDFIRWKGLCGRPKDLRHLQIVRDKLRNS